MVKIQILGSGCKNCNKLKAEAEKAAKNLCLDYELEKVTDFGDISAMGVMSTPALAINGEVKFSGKVKSAKEIESYLK